MSKAWVTKTKSGNFQVSWYEGRDQNGKLKKHSKVQYSRDQAEGFKADIIHKLNRGLTTSLLAVPWDQLKYEYIEAKQAERKAKATIIEIVGMFKRFERLVGLLRSTELQQEHLDKFKRLRGNECKSANTLNKDLANLKAFVRYFSIDRAYIRPYMVIKQVKATVKPVRALTEEQIQSLLCSLKQNSRPYYIRALLALCAGLDVSSIDYIRIQDIHFEDDTIDTFRPKKSKWHAMRPIQSAVMNEIADFWLHQKDGQVRLLPDRYTWYAWNQLCDSAGINSTFHNLRKTYASMLVKKGVSLAVAQGLLDHQSIETTRKFYLDITGEEKKAADSLPAASWIGR